MNKRISELPEAEAYNKDDYVPIVHDGNTLKMSVGLITGNTTPSWANIQGKPFTSVNPTHFKSSSTQLSLTDTAWDYISKVPSIDTRLTTNENKVKTLETSSHTHSNKDTIDKFSVKNGSLLWDGNPINENGLDFEALTRALTTGELTNIKITADRANQCFNIGVTIGNITINSDGEWVIDGKKTGVSALGVDGYSPEASVTTKDNVSTITIKDKDGETTAEVVSPVFSYEKRQDSVEFIIKDAEGVKAVNVSGFSPIIETTPIENGINVNITDYNGSKSYNLYNGKDGVDGITTIETTKQYYNVTLKADGWRNSVAPYEQAVGLDEITAEMNPVVDLVVSDSIQVGCREEQSWSCVTRILTRDKMLVAQCYTEKPTVDLNLIVEVC